MVGTDIAHCEPGKEFVLARAVREKGRIGADVSPSPDSATWSSGMAHAAHRAHVYASPAAASGRPDGDDSDSACSQQGQLPHQRHSGRHSEARWFGGFSAHCVSFMRASNVVLRV